MTIDEIYENNRRIDNFINPPSGALFVPKGFEVLYPNYNCDWNALMLVCRKIICMYRDNRQDIFNGLRNCDIEATYKAVLEFIDFWYDESRPKYRWVNVPYPYYPEPKGKII